MILDHLFDRSPRMDSKFSAKEWLILGGSILAGLGVMIAFPVLGSSGQILGGLDTSQAQTPLLQLFASGSYGFAMTLLGVLLGAIYRRLILLQKRNVETVNFRPFLSSVLRSPDFLIGLVGAPIVFGLIWQALGATSLPAYTVIALQNGFAANALIAQLSQAAPDIPTPKSSSSS